MDNIYLEDLKNEIEFHNSKKNNSGWRNLRLVGFGDQSDKYNVSFIQMFKTYDGYESLEYDYGNFDTYTEALLFIILKEKNIIHAMDKNRDP